MLSPEVADSLQHIAWPIELLALVLISVEYFAPTASSRLDKAAYRQWIATSESISRYVRLSRPKSKRYHMPGVQGSSIAQRRGAFATSVAIPFALSILVGTIGTLATPSRDTLDQAVGWAVLATLSWYGLLYYALADHRPVLMRFVKGVGQVPPLGSLGLVLAGLAFLCESYQLATLRWGPVTYTCVEAVNRCGSP